MSQTPLLFESPSYLNNLTSQTMVSPKQWQTPTGESLSINTDNWTISSSTQSAPITEWLVNESNYQMTLSGEQGGFEPLTQTFAISMIGQLFPKDLLQYLTSINQVYSQMNDDANVPPNTPEKQDKQTDTPQSDNPIPTPNTPPSNNDDESDMW